MQLAQEILEIQRNKKKKKEKRELTKQLETLKEDETTLSDDATVFWDGVYYHKSAGCININTDALLREITLKTAEDNGYDICPNCWKN